VGERDKLAPSPYKCVSASLTKTQARGGSNCLSLIPVFTEDKMVGINPWDTGMAKIILNRFKTTAQTNVCTEEQMEAKDKKLSLQGSELVESGISLLFHDVGGKKYLEVRGYDEAMNQFSYKFVYGARQPVMMRLVSKFGDIQKMLVSVEKNISGVEVTQR